MNRPLRKLVVARLLVAVVGHRRGHGSRQAGPTKSSTAQGRRHPDRRLGGSRSASPTASTRPASTSATRSASTRTCSSARSSATTTCRAPGQQARCRTSPRRCRSRRTAARPTRSSSRPGVKFAPAGEPRSHLEGLPVRDAAAREPEERRPVRASTTPSSRASTHCAKGKAKSISGITTPNARRSSST